jgi:signal transduction histidine kinase
LTDFREKIRSSLRLEIVRYVLLSLLLALICLGFISFSWQSLFTWIIEPKLADKALASGVIHFQEYVTDQKISSTDINMIYGWTDGAVLAFASGINDVHGDQNRGRASWQMQGGRGDSKNWDTQIFTKIAYSNGSVNTRFVYVSNSTVFFLGILLAAVFSCILFFLHFYHLLNRKLNYITEIEDGISILESGDLSYIVPVHGEDELGRLALSINSMSKSLTERIASEQQALLTGREIIGDLSHDIRTPLTILSGYIPILLESHPLTDEQREYLEMMNKKTDQMRIRIDELLDYATIYSGQVKMKRIHMNAKALIVQLIEELAPFHPETSDSISAECFVYADPVLLERIFDNLLSNIHKYADAEQKIKLCCREQDDNLILELENSILPSAPADGKSLGVKIIGYIMHLHGGTKKIYQENRIYRIRLTFPISHVTP